MTKAASRAHASVGSQAVGSPSAPSHSWRRTVWRCAVIVAVAVTVTLAWTFWWHIDSAFGRDGVLDVALDFLSWTFAPCFLVAVALCVTTAWIVRRQGPWRSALFGAAATLVAPPLWALGICLYDDDLAYVPEAALVAEMAWIVTLQPLWALLLMNVVMSARESRADSM